MRIIFTPFRQYLRISLLIAFCLLFSSLTMAEPLRFQTGKSAFDKGDFAAAFKVFHLLVQQQPGDPELDFLLGRSAFAIGDFETAIFAFERVLIAQPEADRVRLELGRSYFEIGDLESARSSFNRVLANRPPLSVQQNIERYLQLISKAAQQHNLSGSLTLGISYDNNAHASPVDEQIQTVIGTVTLNGNGATPQQDLISQNSLQLNHLYRSHPKKVGWLSSLRLYNSLYATEENLNLNLFGLSSGPLWQQGKRQTKLQLNFNLLTLDEERYLSIAGLSAEHSWQLSNKLTAAISGQVARLNYAADGRDANQYRLEFKQSWRLSQGRFMVAIGLEENRAKLEEYACLRKLLSLRYERPLPWRLTGSFAVRLQASDYDEQIPLFGRARKDRLRELSLGLSRPLWKKPDGNGQVQAQLLGTLSKTNSNIDLYEYDKQVLSFALSYLF